MILVDALLAVLVSAAPAEPRMLGPGTETVIKLTAPERASAEDDSRGR